MAESRREASAYGMGCPTARDRSAQGPTAQRRLSVDAVPPARTPAIRGRGTGAPCVPPRACCRLHGGGVA